MLLINCTTHLELNWIEDYFINDRNFANFEITDIKLHVPIFIY